MEGLSNISLSPSTQIEHIHAVSPGTLLRIKFVIDKRMREIEVIPESFRHDPTIFTTARLDCPIDLSREVYIPQWGQVPLHHYIII